MFKKTLRWKNSPSGASGRGVLGIKGIKDLFLKKIQEELDGKDYSTILCSAKPVHCQITCVMLLSYFLKIKNLAGILITIDRPHYFFKRLAKANDLEIDKLTFIDAAQSLSREKKEDDERVHYISNPLGKNGQQLFDEIRALGSAKFVAFDNITKALDYTTEGRLLEFIETLSEFVSSRKELKAVMLTDLENSSEMYESMAQRCEYNFEISTGFLR